MVDVDTAIGGSVGGTATHPVGGSTLDKVGGTATNFDAGAISVQELQELPVESHVNTGSGITQSVSFKCGSHDNSVLAGLSNTANVQQTFDDIAFGVYCDRGVLNVYEHGVHKGTFGSYTDTDSIFVKVTGTIVEYQKNGSNFYTSSTPATFPLHVDTSFRDPKTSLRFGLKDVAICIGPEPTASPTLAPTHGPSDHTECSSGTAGAAGGPFTDAEYETHAPTETDDRECAACTVCPAGTMVAQGCNKPDPWAGQLWSSDASGAAANAISVSQDSSVEGKVVVVHHGHDKVGCGVLEHQPSGEFLANIAPMPGYAGAVSASGSFQLSQSGPVLSGLYTLGGLPASSAGMFHVHAGTSCTDPGAHLTNDAAGHAHHHNEDGLETNSDRRRLTQADHPSDGDAPTPGDAVCAPCEAGTSFSTAQNAPTCSPVTVCAAGFKQAAAATATSDQVCAACANVPANSVLVAGGCEFTCNSGFTLTNAGTTCSDDELRATLKFDDRADIHVYDNNVMQIETTAGGCVDAPAFCSGSYVKLQASVKSLRKDLSAISAFLVATDGYSPA
jgi:hypothetical protein